MRLALKLAIAVILLILFIWFFAINKIEKFEVFGATKIASNTYMECLNECEKIPGWQNLGEGHASLFCANSCNNMISGVVQGRHPNTHNLTKYSTISTRLKQPSPPFGKGCGNYQDNPQCYTKLGSGARITEYCKDECNFNKLSGASDESINNCVRLCTTNMMPNSDWGEWDWH